MCIVNSKKCTKCGELKPLSEYFKNIRALDGLSHHCKLCQKETYAKYYASHRKEGLSRSKKYYMEHREEKTAYDREYRLKNRAKILGRNENRREEISVYNKRHLQAEEGRLSRKAASMRRRVRTGGKRLSLQDVREVMLEYGGLCPYCNNMIPVNKGNIDHIVPVSKGGTNIRENLVYVCSACNSKKMANSLLVFLISKLSDSKLEKVYP